MLPSHEERVKRFLEVHGFDSLEATAKLSAEEKKKLDAEFRAERTKDEFEFYGDGDAKKISRAEAKRILPVGEKVVLIHAMGSYCEKPRTVAAHRSYGFDLAVPGKNETSRLGFESGETVWISGQILSIRDKDNVAIVRYRLNERNTEVLYEALKGIVHQ